MFGLMGVARGSGQPGGVRYTYYVDSVLGSNANAGTSQALAKQTIAGLPTLTNGDSVGLVAGSYWPEALSIAGKTITLASVGNSPLPEFDGAGLVAETWVQDDAATYPNVWLINVTHGFSVGFPGRMMIWQDGVMLVRTTSIANVNATPGTYYSQYDNNWGIPVVKIHIHPTGSGNPNSNGKVYERTKRYNVIAGAYSGGTGQVARGIVTGRQGNADGSLILGVGSTMDKCLAYDGHKHNALQESGTCTDSVFINAQPESNYLHVFYAPDAAGYTGVYNNCIFVGREDGQRQNNAIYCHDNAGTAHAALTINGCAFANLASGVSAIATTLTIAGMYAENLAPAFGTITATTSNLSHLLINGCHYGNTFNSAGTHTLTQCAVSQSGATGTQEFLRAGSTNWGDISLSQSTIRIGDWPSNGSRWVFRRISGTGTFSASNNVFLIDDTVSSVTDVFTADTASIGTINNNVYYVRGTFAKSSLRWNVDGVAKTFAQWQALGFDTNSRVYDSTDIAFASFFEGEPESGDFRLKSGLSLTLPDATPISGLGVQEHYDFNARAVVAGAPSVWPDIPKTKAEGLTYIASPRAWDFYP